MARPDPALVTDLAPCASREPPSWVRETRARSLATDPPRRPWRRLPGALLVLAGLALPCLARQVAIPTRYSTGRAWYTWCARSPREVVGGWGVRLFSDSPLDPTLAGYGHEPYALALGAGSVAALVLSAVRRRPLRAGGQALVAVALLVVLGAQVVEWSGKYAHWTTLAWGAWLTLPLVAVGVSVARRTGVSVVLVGLLLGAAATEVGPLLRWGVDVYGADARVWVVRSAAVDVLCGVALAGGGWWLTRRRRVSECDLSGVLSACSAGADVAVLPWAWLRLGQRALEHSIAWTREVTWGLGCYGLQTALESPAGRCATTALLTVGALAAFALVLRARDRRDRGLALAGGAA